MRLDVRQTLRTVVDLRNAHAGAKGDAVHQRLVDADAMRRRVDDLFLNAVDAAELQGIDFVLPQGTQIARAPRSHAGNRVELALRLQQQTAVVVDFLLLQQRAGILT